MSLSPRIQASIGTTVIVGLALLLMFCCHLGLASTKIVPEEQPTIFMDEEYIDILQMPSAPDMKGDEPSRAQADEQLSAQPTPISGTDVEDAGSGVDAPKVVAQKEESPMKVKEKEPEQPAPAVDKKKKEEEEIQRQANNEIANAFNKSQGKHNNASGASDDGNNGTPSGNSPQGTLTGSGTGTAGGGWSIPSYAPVLSTVTGSVKMVVTIDRYGNVTNLRFDGGDAPAATNSQVRQACAAEVKSRKFTRANYENAPETSTAYITYTFK
ncbi:MAG: hypothetical protein LUD17_03545 [Bacteroidales bacterium]|nr:hypothetical protein [Bacteroidales bacterium]